MIENIISELSLRRLLTKRLDDAILEIQQKNIEKKPIAQHLSIIRTELESAARSGFSAVESRLRIAANEQLCKETNLSADDRIDLLNRASAFLADPGQPSWESAPWPHTRGAITGAFGGSAIGAWYWVFLAIYAPGWGSLLQQLAWCIKGAIVGAAVHEAAWFALRQHKLSDAKKSLLPFLRKYYEQKLDDGLARYSELLNTELSSGVEEK